MNFNQQHILKELNQILTIKDGKICNYECTNDMLKFISKNQSKIIKFVQKELKQESDEKINKITI